MASYIPVNDFGLSLPRRISRLYNDTKKSSDFVKEPIYNEEDPEIKVLHRKLRIQKDRLISWGLEWSDPNQSTEIDESLSRAGIAELVGGIMATVQEILVEAEQLWSSYQQPGRSNKSPVDIKRPIIVWNKAKFQDLVHDLTTLIDLLYDVSRTRSTGITAAYVGKASIKTAAPATEELRPFEPSRRQAPNEISPEVLTNATTMEPGGSLILGNGNRDVVVMSKSAYSELPRGTPPWAPLLLEYADFDPVFASTGIWPSMDKFEKLCNGLRMDSPRQSSTWNGLPSLLGYFPDTDHARLGLLYHFPSSFAPISQSNTRENNCSMFPLSDILARPDFAPTLEAKFRLANNLANTIFDMHSRGIIHGNLCDQSILFCNAPSSSEIDLRKPVIAGFDLFPDGPYQNGERVATLYRHPLDPKVTPESPLPANGEHKVLDLYSLAMLLVSIATWTSLENLVPSATAPSVSESFLPQIAIQCGTLYMKAVQACWNAVDDQLSGKSSSEVLTKVDIIVSRYLEACCILDSVSSLDERLRDDLGESVAQAEATPVAGPSTPPHEKPVSSQAQPEETPHNTIKSAPAVELVARMTEWPLNIKKDFRFEQAKVETKSSAPKTRLYPNIPLQNDAIEQWNSVILPQVNAALRSFYKKHPESVEISLESIGESPHKTQPTVLIICNSVPKVRAILKKKLGGFFDGSTQFALKVCKGQVLRSHKYSTRRSMARCQMSSCESVASNQSFQSRPHNGASIGAWIGSKHLPPVSFGGLIVVDNKPYGMTVHHMLDDPDQEVLNLNDPVLRSIGARGDYAVSSAGSTQSSDYACEFSDEEEEDYDDSDITSDDGEEGEDDEFDPGDIPGIEPGLGDGFIVTQPAIDDVEDNFFASDETADEEHLESFTLGEVYASSGIRRRKHNGLTHEIDWALFKFDKERLPSENSIPQAENLCIFDVSEVHPTTVAPTSSLPGLEISCIARSSGLQTGTIMPALSSVKLYGRSSPSDSYQICRSENEIIEAGVPPMGVPGDSGAWIIDRRQGRLCGHILAWSERKQVAYLCPMDVLLFDIAETLEATVVKLPGGQAVVQITEQDEEAQQSQDAVDEGYDDLNDVDQKPEELANLVHQKSPRSSSISSPKSKTKQSFEEIQMSEIETQMKDISLSGTPLTPGIKSTV